MENGFSEGKNRSSKIITAEIKQLFAPDGEKWTNSEYALEIKWAGLDAG